MIANTKINPNAIILHVDNTYICKKNNRKLEWCLCTQCKFLKSVDNNFTHIKCMYNKNKANTL